MKKAASGDLQTIVDGFNRHNELVAPPPAKRRRSTRMVEVARGVLEERFETLSGTHRIAAGPWVPSSKAAKKSKSSVKSGSKRRRRKAVALRLSLLLRVRKRSLTLQGQHVSQSEQLRLPRNSWNCRLLPSSSKHLVIRLILIAESDVSAW